MSPVCGNFLIEIGNLNCLTIYEDEYFEMFKLKLHKQVDYINSPIENQDQENSILPDSFTRIYI